MRNKHSSLLWCSTASSSFLHLFGFFFIIAYTAPLYSTRRFQKNHRNIVFFFFIIILYLAIRETCYYSIKTHNNGPCIVLEPFPAAVTYHGLHRADRNKEYNMEGYTWCPVPIYNVSLFSYHDYNHLLHLISIFSSSFDRNIIVLGIDII